MGEVAGAAPKDDRTPRPRPAHALAPNPAGTTDLNDMLTDACAHCEPYCGGYVQ